MNLKRLLSAVVLALWALTAAALPSVEDVQAEIGRGNYVQAETMMSEVVAARPGSARAHYVYAEILAHNKRYADAAAQAALARAADPALRFTDAAKFAAFEQLLEREQRAGKASGSGVSAGTLGVPRAMPEPAATGGMPGWVWMVGLAAAAAGLWAWTSRRRATVGAPFAMGSAAGSPSNAAAMSPAPGYGPAPGGYGPPSGAAPAAAGSGMLGVGLAAAGGLAAGMLAEKLLSDRHGSGAGLFGSGAGAAAGGSFVPGPSDDDPAADAAAREIEQRPVDFGSGDGWGGGDGGGSAGDDGW